MSAIAIDVAAQVGSSSPAVQEKIVARIDKLISALPRVADLTAEQRRGIVARYTAVLEGNFIYWMTATLLAVKSKDAEPHILENLHEECRDSHPAMLRRFAIAAHAFPTDTDALIVDADLTKVRLFLGRMQGVPSLITMAFFEAWIQRFMPFLTDLALALGSTDREYTDVHGLCDIAHSQELFDSVGMEMAVNPAAPHVDIYEGVDLLTSLIHTIVEDRVQAA